MAKKKSLTDIAYEAGFQNISCRASQASHLMGSVMSDNFECIYFKCVPKKHVEIFGIVDQYDYEFCAIYRIDRDYLKRYVGGDSMCNPGAGGINIDKEEPVFKGKMAVDIIQVYVKYNDQGKKELNKN